MIQHETDHLDGVLFFDRMKSFQSLTFLDEFGRYWSGHPVRVRAEMAISFTATELPASQLSALEAAKLEAWKPVKLSRR